MLTRLANRFSAYRSVRPEVRWAAMAYDAGLASGFLAGVVATFLFAVVLIAVERIT